MIFITFNEKCEELKKIIIASYDWTGKSTFDENFEENLKKNPQIRKFYYENFKNI